MNKAEYKKICDIINAEQVDWINPSEDMWEALENVKKTIKYEFEVEE